MRVRRSVVVALLLLLPVALLPAASGETAAKQRFIVGYEPGNEAVVEAAIQAAGGDAKRWNTEMGWVLAETSDPQLFVTTVSSSPSVRYVERDDGTALAGSQWNGSQWNGAQWNGAQWNGAQWNGAQWNGAQWNDAELKDVSEAQRRAAKWTEAHYQSDSTNKMKWAGDATDPGMVWQWAPWATDANHAWTAGHTGTRTAKLCVLDSGVATKHRDIAPNLWSGGGYNAISPGASWEDDAGHGTHIAGIAAGALANAYGIAGVANVLIMPVKVLDANGYGHESDLAWGIWWCAKNGADVAVMALSATQPGPTMDSALHYAKARDVLMLASAGNVVTAPGETPCSSCVAYPASDPRVVAVAAVDGNLTRASFSRGGAEVELAAPGVHLLGPFPGDAFVFGSGTSQAVAYAAGVAALVRDERPHLTADEVRARLAASTVDLGPAGRDVAFGHGLLDVRLATR